MAQDADPKENRPDPRTVKARVQRYARRYIEGGYHLVKIPPGTKGPRNLDWHKHDVAPDTIGIGDGIGINHWKSGTASIDFDDLELSAHVLDHFGVDVESMVTAGPAVWYGNPDNRRKVLFRMPEEAVVSGVKKLSVDRGNGEDPPKQHVVFELRGTTEEKGVQDVFPPSIHPDTGKPYEWAVDPVERDNLPELPAAVLYIWTHWDKLLPAMRLLAGDTTVEPITERQPPRGDGSGAELIAKWNALHSVGEVLERNGFVPHGKRWLRPGSSSGLPGVLELEPGRIYAHDGSALSDGHSHDAFDCFRILEHRRDMAVAMRAAREEVGPSPRSGGKGGAQTESPEIEVEINRLAGLSAIDYERVRVEAAEALGFRASMLDRFVQEARGERDQQGLKGEGVSLYVPEPWDEPVEGSRLLDAALAVVQRHMSIRDPEAYAVPLWVAHEHVFDVFSHTPRLLVTSPAPECGKSVLMVHIVGRLGTRILSSELMTPATFFRLAQSQHPCFLIDEADLFIQDDSEVLAAINNGWEAHGRVLRCVGDDHVVRAFSTHAPVALGGIDLHKKLPHTTISRSVAIHLDRASASELSEEDAFDKRKHDARLLELGRKFARWAQDHRAALRDIDPRMPAGVRNRLADKWRPLFAVAEVAGGDWPERAKAALFGQQDLSEPSKGQQLLEDLREVFKPMETHVSTKALIDRLCALPESPWADYNFRARDAEHRSISDRQLGGLLRGYKVRPQTVRWGGDTAKGYKRKDLEKAWERYLTHAEGPQGGDLAVTPSQPSDTNGFGRSLSVTLSEVVTDRKSLKPAPRKDCDGVTDRKWGYGDDHTDPHQKRHVSGQKTTPAAGLILSTSCAHCQEFNHSNRCVKGHATDPVSMAVPYDCPDFNPTR